MKRTLTALLALCLISLCAAAEEFALRKAVTKFASETKVNRSISQQANEWRIEKYTFDQCQQSQLNPLNAAYDNDLGNKKVSLAFQRSAPFAFSIDYSPIAAPLRLNSETYTNIIMIVGQEMTPGQAIRLAQTIVAVLWSEPDTEGLVQGEMYIIERNPHVASYNDNFNTPVPQVENDNLMRLTFYNQVYQENGNYYHGTNIVNAVALVVPEIIRLGTPAEIQSAQNLLANMIAITPSPERAGTNMSWREELEHCSGTLLNLMQRLLLLGANGSGQNQATPGMFTINGSIDSGLWDVGYYVYTSDNGLTVNTTDSDLIMADAQSFSFQSELDQITIGRLQALFKDGSKCNSWMEFPFVPGETANLTVHNGCFTLTGSGFYDQYSAVVNIQSADALYNYAKQHGDEPGAVCAAFLSQKLTPDQLIELYALLPVKYKSDYIGAFLRKMLQ